MSTSILAPAAALVACTILVLFWMAARRFPVSAQGCYRCAKNKQKHANRKGDPA
ncbi:MAG: hypothetical protein ACX93N_05115 [Pseudohaliea sp.]